MKGCMRKHNKHGENILAEIDKNYPDGLIALNMGGDKADYGDMFAKFLVVEIRDVTKDAKSMTEAADRAYEVFRRVIKDCVDASFATAGAEKIFQRAGKSRKPARVKPANPPKAAPKAAPQASLALSCPPKLLQDARDYLVARRANPTGRIVPVPAGVRAGLLEANDRKWTWADLGDLMGRDSMFPFRVAKGSVSTVGGVAARRPVQECSEEELESLEAIVSLASKWGPPKKHKAEIKLAAGFLLAPLRTLRNDPARMKALTLVSNRGQASIDKAVTNAIRTIEDNGLLRQNIIETLCKDSGVARVVASIKKKGQ